MSSDEVRGSRGAPSEPGVRWSARDRESTAVGKNYTLQDKIDTDMKRGNREVKVSSHLNIYPHDTRNGSNWPNNTSSREVGEEGMRGK